MVLLDQILLDDRTWPGEAIDEERVALFCELIRDHATPEPARSSASTAPRARQTRSHPRHLPRPHRPRARGACHRTAIVRVRLRTTRPGSQTLPRPKPQASRLPAPESRVSATTAPGSAAAVDLDRDDRFVAQAQVPNGGRLLRKVTSMSRGGRCLRVSERWLRWQGWLAGAGVARDRGCCRSRMVCRGPETG